MPDFSVGIQCTHSGLGKKNLKEVPSNKMLCILKQFLVLYMKEYQKSWHVFGNEKQQASKWDTVYIYRPHELVKQG